MGCWEHGSDIRVMEDNGYDVLFDPLDAVVVNTPDSGSLSPASSAQSLQVNQS